MFKKGLSVFLMLVMVLTVGIVPAFADGFIDNNPSGEDTLEDVELVENILYDVEDGFVLGIDAGMKVSGFALAFNNAGYIGVYDTDGTALEAKDGIATGMTVRSEKDDTVYDEAVAVVSGDVNGDGNVSVTDIVADRSHILGDNTLKGAYFKAGDLDSGNVINVTDIVSIRNIILTSADADTINEQLVSYNTQTVTFEDIKDLYKTQGRTSLSEGKFCFDWTASGFEMNGFFEGDIILNFSQTPTEDSNIMVAVDGVERVVSLTNTSSAVTIATGIEKGYHNITVHRMSENNTGYQMTINNITFTGVLTKAPLNKELLIEFIGDSGSCGCGNIWDPTGDHIFSRDEDGTKAFTTLTARALGVDYNILSRSGATLCAGTNGIQDMPSQYLYTSGFRNNDEWGFERTADIVVIGLGANDVAHNMDSDYFYNSAIAFGKLVREKNPHAKIVFVSYITTEQGNHYWEDIWPSIIEEFGGSLNGYYFTTVKNISPAGWAGHPNIEQCEAIAEELTAFLEPLVSEAEAINDYPFDKYCYETYTEALWDTSRGVMYNESGVFHSDINGVVDEIQLMYDPKTIVSVRNYGLDKEYEYGVDYTITEEGNLKWIEGSSIPILTFDIRYNDGSKKDWPATINGQTYYTNMIHDIMAGYTVMITYTHEDTWDGFIPVNETSSLPKTMEKLESGEKIKMVYYGSSHVEGYDASSLYDIAPYTPVWTDVTTQALNDKYPGQVTAVNTAKAGEDNEWGIENLDERVLAENPDLVLISFGNTVVSRETYAAQVQTMIDRILEQNPDCEFILESVYDCNPDLDMYANDGLAEYELAQEDVIADNPDVGIALMRINKFSQSLLAVKQFEEIQFNGINHYNDFGLRMKVSVFMQMFGLYE